MTENPHIIKWIQSPETFEKGFAMLIDQYKRPLYQSIRRMVVSHDDTDEILQITFIKAWKGLSRFRQESSLWTWLYRIAINVTLDFLTQKKKRKFTHHLPEHMTQAMDSGFSGTEIQRKLIEAMQQLPDKQKAVFSMKYFDNMTYEDISKITNTSVGALKASYHLSVKKIEEFLNRL